MIAAISNFRSRMRAAALRSTFTRSCHGNRAHAGWAARAAFTAASTCSAVQLANRPSTSEVSMGETSTIGSRPFTSTALPLM
jgi:hypothetical protein